MCDVCGKKMISIVELLRLRGLDCSKKIKLVRHKDKRYDVAQLYSLGQIEIYQSYQAKDIFKCDYIVSFIGFEGSLARMVGVYKVNGRRPAREMPLPAEFIYQYMPQDDDIYYDLEEVSGFEDLKDRVVIEWGKGALAWHQNLTDKEVVEILPSGYVKPFPGYLDFILTYDELVGICENPVANKDWHRMSSSVAGIYLIVDSETGLQYVGSAYGSGGILARWRQYAKTGHGGNLRLKAAIAANQFGSKSLRFAILRTLEKTLTKNEVIAYEAFHKKKLGTRAFGLNSN
jgi:hypothetical protein